MKLYLFSVLIILRTENGILSQGTWTTKQTPSFVVPLKHEKASNTKLKMIPDSCMWFLLLL